MYTAVIMIILIDSNIINALVSVCLYVATHFRNRYTVCDETVSNNTWRLFCFVFTITLLFLNYEILYGMCPYGYSLYFL